MRGDDQRRTRGERCREAGRDEEVRVDDVGMECARRAPGIAKQGDVTASSTTARVDDRAFDLVAERDELRLEVRDEDAEVGVVRAGVHL